MNIDDLKNIAWMIKYRPKTLDNVVGKEAKLLKKYVDSNNLQHFLLSSRTPGTGKTTCAKAIINDTGADYIEINSSDERGIDVIRDKIKLFVSTMSSKPGLKKIVFLDEMDSMTKTAQDALRNMMEKFMTNAIFILTCNYIEKVIEPIKNRCEVIVFDSPDKAEIRKYLLNIIDAESVKYTSDGLNKLIDMNYPSIRESVNTLQKFKTMDIELNPINLKKNNEKFDILWTDIKSGKVLNVRKEICENNYNPELLLKHFWAKTYTDEKLTIKQKIKLVSVLADVDYKMSIGASKNIQIDNMLFKIVGALI